MKKCYLFLAEGFEEIEAIATVDILRRAGVNVNVVSICKTIHVKGAHGIVVEADMMFDNQDFSEGDMLILPGGMPGTLNLQAHDGLKKLIINYDEEKKYIAAICAAPLILGSLEILQNRKAICYPGFEKELKGAQITSERVVVDKNIITSAGPGTAYDFGLKLAELLTGKENADSVSAGMLIL